MVNKNKKNNSSNISNSLVFGLWLQTKTCFDEMWPFVSENGRISPLTTTRYQLASFLKHSRDETLKILRIVIMSHRNKSLTFCLSMTSRNSTFSDS